MSRNELLALSDSLNRPFDSYRVSAAIKNNAKLEADRLDVCKLQVRVDRNSPNHIHVGFMSEAKQGVVFCCPDLHWDHGFLRTVMFYDCLIPTASFVSTHMSDICYHRCDLTAANFNRVYGWAIQFSQVQLDGASLRATKGVLMLKQSSARGCNFAAADLQYCKFNGTDLTGSSFKHANIRGADFQEACLTDVSFEKAIWDAKTKWPAGYQPPSRESSRRNGEHIKQGISEVSHEQKP